MTTPLIKERSIRLLLHDIRSLWNVGSMFRTADAFALEKLYLTGYTALPPRREIAKTALGADSWVTWESAASPEEVILQCKKDGYVVIGLEITRESKDLSRVIPTGNMLLVVGNEVTGVPEKLLRLCDAVAHIPMLGKKESLNVSVSAGIALHHLRFA